MNRTIVPLVLVATLTGVSGLAAAQSDAVYKCIDEHGNVTFANTGSTKGCTKLNVDPVVIPKYQAPRTANTTTNPNFPKVDGATQKARDTDRRRILEDELRDKNTRLADLKREYNNGEPERQGNERNYQRYLDRVAQLKADIARTESDVASIKSEIGKVQ
jgi:Domain of unknown function (DUF4124)